MKILNFGSMNIDYVYKVVHFVRAGETLSSLSMETHCGGKGLNQSIAIARAGARVSHAGIVGAGGGFLLRKMKESGVDTSLTRESGETAGHAVIQVNGEGQNGILLFGGSNRALTEDYIDGVLGRFGEGDLMLLQNETNAVPYLMRQAKKKKLRVAFNASPAGDELKEYPLECVDLFLVNEIEGEAVTGCRDPGEICDGIAARYPRSAVLLTLGKKGALYRKGKISASFGIFDVKVVDTTAAGDTFTGYFLAGLIGGLDIGENLRQASAASAVAVSRMGASDSIPSLAEVRRFLESGAARVIGAEI